MLKKKALWTISFEIISFPNECKRSIAAWYAALFVPKLLVVSQPKVNERTLVNTRCSAKFVITKNFFFFSYLLFYYHMKFTNLLGHEWLTKCNLCCRLVFPPRTWIGIAFWLPFLPEIIQSWFFTLTS